MHFMGHADIANSAADQENRNPSEENQDMTTARTMAAALCLVMWAALALAREPAAKPADAEVRIVVTGYHCRCHGPGVPSVVPALIQILPR